MGVELAVGFRLHRVADGRQRRVDRASPRRQRSRHLHEDALGAIRARRVRAEVDRVTGRDLDFGRDLVARIHQQFGDVELAHRGGHPGQIEVLAGAEFARHLGAVGVERAGVEDRLVVCEGRLGGRVRKPRGVLAEERPGRLPTVLREEHGQEEPREVRVGLEPRRLHVELGQQFALGPAPDRVGDLGEAVLIGLPEAPRRLGVAEPVGPRAAADALGSLAIVGPTHQRGVAVVHLEAAGGIPVRRGEPRGPHRRPEVGIQRAEHVAAKAVERPRARGVSKAERSCHTRLSLSGQLRVLTEGFGDPPPAATRVNDR